MNHTTIAFSNPPACKCKPNEGCTKNGSIEKNTLGRSVERARFDPNAEIQRRRSRPLESLVGPERGDVK